MNPHTTFDSAFRRNAVWFTAINALDRAIAVVQTVLIARLIGITEYGIYGFLFATIGVLGSVVGLQMGLTATVHIARYRTAERAKAAAVINMVGRYGWIVAAIVVIAAAPLSHAIAAYLLGSDKYATAVLLGTMLVAATIVCGIQEGVAQGFEMFRALALTKIGSSLATLAVLVPMTMYFDLNGILVAVLAGLALRYSLLNRALCRSRMNANIPTHGQGVHFRDLVARFALPSMSVSLIVGLVTWVGTFMLSRQPSGFDEVAIVNTGLQWRGPVLLLAATLGGVAIPAFSRLSAQGDADGVGRLRRDLMLVNSGTSIVVAAILAGASGWIMKFYGGAFEAGRLAFAVTVFSTVPMVIANVYMQELVGAGRMWRQLWLHIPYVVVLISGFLLLVPRYQANGYAVALLLGSIVFALHAALATTSESRERLPPGRRS